MRALFAFALALTVSLPARADLAPAPTGPSSPEGAFAWLAVIAAVAALAAIWWRRKR